MARVVATVPVLGAPAAAPEASLGRRHAVAQDGVVDEAEVLREGLGVLLVDDGYGGDGVVGEGEELAPVAGLLFFVVALGGDLVGFEWDERGFGGDTGWPWWKKWRFLSGPSMVVVVREARSWWRRECCFGWDGCLVEKKCVLNRGIDRSSKGGMKSERER